MNQMLIAPTRDTSAAPALRHSRRLRGEIVCDPSGRLYERIGPFVRPVHHLVAGPHGEVLDLAPPPPRPLRREPVVIDVEEPGRAGSAEPAADRSEPQLQAGPPYRELAPASAKPRIVCFGEFKQVLGPQLRYPERLRDGHRLSCRVVVYEATRLLRVEALASMVFEGAAGMLLPLTAALGAKLEIPELVTNRRPAAPREPGTIDAGERVVRLQTIDDPTAALSFAPSTASSAPAAPASASSAMPDLPGRRTVKTMIPERFVGPWPFTVTRDQAVCDLNVERAQSALVRLFTRCRRAIAGGGGRRKWQALLQGKSLDDQLWAVPPPRGGLSDRDVQAWARRTLAAGGYDADAMLLEWEIFWRRKGL